MKKLIAKIVRNSDSTVLEESEFSGMDAQQQLDSWQAGREAQESFGPTQDKSIVVEDITTKYIAGEKVEARTASREFCLQIIDQIAAYNDDHLDAAGMSALISNPAFAGILSLLLAGGIKTARAAMAAAGPLMYPSLFVDDILAKMDAQIAKEVAAKALLVDSATPPESQP